ncbi:hypothetical protein [Brachyspira sp. G79]|uniref:hypothetical protein n=1 Tax=Brachyspira sp. G79 TaxID=1358104 RepID=UPI000BBBD691|nr:hypothetical protein [Brachyspira sp. G79]PCG20528.1 hypothetical protein KQ44_11350 [Brachyspira sp. G79]
MSLLKDIFKKRKEIKCAVCGGAIQDNFAKGTPSVKTKYVNIKNCYGLYMIHYECDKDNK